MPYDYNDVVAGALQRPNSQLADWESCVQSLKSGDVASQQRAAKQLRQFVEAAVREMSVDAFVNFEAELYQRVFALIHGTNITEKLGAVIALDELIDASSSQAEMKVIKLSNNLSRALCTNTDYTLLLHVSRALGHMARSAMVPHAEFVEFEVNRGLEWLNAEQWHRRLAACLVLRELAESAPTTFYVKIKDFFDRILPVLRDRQVAVREAAALALRTCLSLLAQRLSRHHLSWYCAIYDQLLAGMKNSGEADVHSAFLMVGAMLEHSGDFMLPRFNEVCGAVMRLRDHKSPVVCATVTELLPELAHFCPDAFARSYLNEALAYLFRGTSRPETRSGSYLALGRLARAVGHHLDPRLPALVALVLEGLAPRRKTPACPEALPCLSDLVLALGDAMGKYVEDLLDPLFGSGLSEPLIHTLAVISRSLPRHQPAIEDRLLQELAVLLSGRPYALPGSSPPWAAAAAAAAEANAHGGRIIVGGGVIGGSARAAVAAAAMLEDGSVRGGAAGDVVAAKGFAMLWDAPARAAKARAKAKEKAADSAANAESEAVIVLALHTLGTFGLDPGQLTPFVRDCVAAFLAHPAPAVRKEAALTCCRVLPRPGHPLPVRGPSARVVEEVLGQLLHVAVSDPVAEVRRTLLQALDQQSCFDRFLCQAHHLQTLFLLMGDEDFDIRLDAVTMLGRLAAFNPAHLLPPLRLTLTQLIGELQHNDDANAKEEAARTLCHFLRAEALQRLVRPFLSTIIRALRLRGNARLATASLEALGELSRVAGDGMTPYLRHLLPLVIGSVQDQSSVLKREVALRTLGRLVSATNYVIKPYLSYPSLMEQALGVLRGGGNAPWSLRREVLRTLGILGALDPYKYRQLQNRVLRDSYKAGASTEPVSRKRSLAADEAAGNGGSGGGGGAAADAEGGEDSFSEEEVAPLPLLDEDDGGQDAATVMWEQSFMAAQPSPASRQPVLPTPASEDYYPTVAVTALMSILRNESLSVYHGMVTQAIMFIFKSLGLRCVPFLQHVLPHMLHVLRRKDCDAALREGLLQQLASMSAIIKQHVRGFLPAIFQLVEDYWTEHMEQLVPLVEEVSMSVRNDFRPYVPLLLPLLLAALAPPPTPLAATGGRGSRVGSMTTAAGAASASAGGPPPRGSPDARMELSLSCLTVLRPVLSEYLHVVVPALVKLFEAVSDLGGGRALRWQLLTVRTLGNVTSQGALLQHPSLAARMVHPLARVLERDAAADAAGSGELGPAVVDVFTAVAAQLGSRFLIFHPLAARSMRQVRPGLATGRYVHVVRRILRQNGILYSAPNTAAVGIPGQGADAGSGDGSGHLGADSGGGLAAGDENGGIGGVNATAAGQWAALAWGNGEGLGPYFGAGGGDLGGGTGFGMGDDEYIDPYPQDDLLSAYSDPSGGGMGVSKLYVNQQNLQRAWDVAQRSTREDWDEWVRRFAVEVLRESPSPALRSCSALAQVYQPLGRELFHAAFVSCWFELSEPYQENLVRSLEAAFRSFSIPPEILQMLLNLAEFMEHEVEALPIDIRVLAELAQKCHAYAKALHYKEMEFQTSPALCVEALVNVNKKLGQPEAAMGVLTYAQSRLGSAIAVKESWLAKLGHWQEALARYARRRQNDPADVGAVLGCLKCLDALGESEALLVMCKESWAALTSPEADDKAHRKAATLAARAAWSLGEWRLFEHHVSAMEPDLVEAAYFRAILALHRDDFGESAECVDTARQLLDSTFTALVAESYKRAYTSMVTVQQLAELEEIIHYRQAVQHLAVTAAVESNGIGGSGGSGIFALPSGGGSHSGGLGGGGYGGGYGGSFGGGHADAEVLRGELKAKWRMRLEGCTPDVGVWQSILAVRSLVLSPREDVHSWLQFASLCRESGNFSLSEKVLTRLLSLHNSGSPVANGHHHHGNGMATSPLAAEADLRVHHQVEYAHLKHLSAVGRPSEALQNMIRLADNLGPAETGLKVKCLLKIGSWQLARVPPGRPLGPEVQAEVFASYQSAAELEPDNYKGWHSWALVNFRVVEQLLQQQQQQQAAAAAAAAAAGLSPPPAGTVVPLSATGGPPAGGMAGGVGGGGGVGAGTLQRRGSALGRAAAEASAAALQRHLVCAAEGFIRAVQLGKRKWSALVQQDMLNLLTIWFRHGTLPEVLAALRAGLPRINLDAWLGVVPQLIARINIAHRPSRELLHGLLENLGRKHAQALVYPLSVALKSPKAERREAAETLMAAQQQHHAQLVREALLVSDELIRVAILWHELWHEGLEEASRLYFAELNVRGMLAVLAPLHRQLEAGPATAREENFANAFGRELAEAQGCIWRYQQLMAAAGTEVPTGGTGEGGGAAAVAAHAARADAAASEEGERDRQQQQRMQNSSWQPGDGNGEQPPLTPAQQRALAEQALTQAWDLYYNVFRKINKQLPQMTVLELQYVSPQLLAARNLELAVPGTYRVSGEAVRIASFLPTVQVIPSKQRPRKLTIRGEDGRDYVLLLKGHEDLRQDERVMQLFGLVNALLAKDRRTNKADLAIQRYAVAPLSHNAGVVGWVPNCDTLHALIRDYRDGRKILLNIEHRLMSQASSPCEYDSLTLMQKVEVFEMALDHTAGQDLYKVLWLKSQNSEAWLDRRTNFSRSLAVMSMVGYILGLGDRHPSNLMLDRFTGKVLHIDFGDCFEVAMHRDKFPERIPFRLTRMLSNAMEVSGIEGNFRTTCERVMAVLRENRDSLVAMLEAFVHDPLISWRLLGAVQRDGNSVEEEEGMGSSGNDSSASQPRAVPAPQGSSGGTGGGGDGRQAAAAAAGGGASGAAKASSAATGDAAAARRFSTQEGGDGGGSGSGSGGRETGRRSRTGEPHGAAEEAAGGQASAAVSQGPSLGREQREYQGQQVSQHQTAPQQQSTAAAAAGAVGPPNIAEPPRRRPSQIATLPAVAEQGYSSDEESGEDGGRSRRSRRGRRGGNADSDGDGGDEEAGRQNGGGGGAGEDVAPPGSLPVPSSAALRRGSTDTRSGREAAAVAAAVAARARNAADPPADAESSDEDASPRNGSGDGAYGGGRGGAKVSTSHRQSLHLRMQAMAASVTASSTRFLAADGSGGGGAAGHSSVAASRLDHHRSTRERELVMTLGPEGAAAPPDALNEKAVAVIKRVQDKLTGRDFGDGTSEPLDVAGQVDRLIRQATSNENLCQCFIGWCPFW